MGNLVYYYSVLLTVTVSLASHSWKIKFDPRQRAASWNHGAIRATVSSELCGRTRSCVCTVLHFGQLRSYVVQRRLSSEQIKTEVSLADYISETVMGFINRMLEMNTVYQNSPHL